LDLGSFDGRNWLTSGYLNDPDATSSLFTDESREWIHTGDIGIFDEVNTLVIVDRICSILKLTQEEYVAAEMISQIFVYGDSSRDRLIAIVVPNIETVKQLLKKPILSEEEFKKVCMQNSLNAEIKMECDLIHNEHNLLGFHRISDVRCDPGLLVN
jgi:long-subunit acyl-CoA synthetase (AMP-forming)